MSTILIYTSPARGHLYPMMDVAIALRAGGHRVVIQTLASEHDLVVGQGLEHRPISAHVETLELDDYKGGNPLKPLRRTLACWQSRAPSEVQDLRAAAAELEPAVAQELVQAGQSAFTNGMQLGMFTAAALIAIGAVLVALLHPSTQQN